MRRFGLARASVFCLRTSYHRVHIEVVSEVLRSADGRDRVLEDHFVSTVIFHDDGKPIETLDPPAQFRAVHQVDGHTGPFPSSVVQKAILYIRRLFLHVPLLPQ